MSPLKVFCWVMGGLLIFATSCAPLLQERPLETEFAVRKLAQEFAKRHPELIDEALLACTSLEIFLITEPDYGSLASEWQAYLAGVKGSKEVRRLAAALFNLGFLKLQEFYPAELLQKTDAFKRFRILATTPGLVQAGTRAR